MNLFAKKALSVLLLCSLLRGIVHIAVMAGEGFLQDYSSHALQWHAADDSSWDDLLDDALADQKKEEREDKEENEEKKSEEKEGAERKSEAEGRRRAEAQPYFFPGENHTTVESLLFNIQHRCEVTFHFVKSGYISYHAAVSQKTYLKIHALKIPCPHSMA